MKIWEFEKAVWDLDGVRIVIRGESDDKVGDYKFAKAASGNSPFQKFIDTRLRSRVGAREVFAINGSGHIVHTATHMTNIRATYDAG